MDLRKIKPSSRLERAMYSAARKAGLPQRVNREGKSDRADKQAERRRAIGRSMPDVKLRRKPMLAGNSR